MFYTCNLWGSEARFLSWCKAPGSFGDLAPYLDLLDRFAPIRRPAAFSF